MGDVGYECAAKMMSETGLNAEAGRRVFWPGLLIGAFFFVVGLPTLSWVEFTNGSENLNIATALEIRRTGKWLLPTLQGEPRFAKPPLTAWMTALSLRQKTFEELSSNDAGVRRKAYAEAAWQMRWGAYLCACVTVFAVYVLGQMIGGIGLGISAGLIYGTTFAFIRFSRMATTDVHLALWVAVANVFLARAILEGRVWSGHIGAGVAIGLAFMSKGPVCLAQTVAPALVFVGWRGYASRGAGRVAGGSLRRAWPAVAVAVVLGVLIAAPWFLYVASEHDAWGRWRQDMITGPQTLDGDPVLAYLSIFVVMLPWTVVFVVGLSASVAEFVIGHRAKRDLPAMAYAVCLVVVPIVIMTCFHERKERYLLPMVGGAAVVAGWGLGLCLPGLSGIARNVRQGVIGVQAGVLAGVGVMVPLLGATGLVGVMRRADGTAWFSWGLAGLAAAACVVILWAGWYWQRRRAESLVLSGALVMVIVQTTGMWGHRHSELAETRWLAEEIWERYGQAEVYSYRPGQPGRRAPEELSIYLNRAVRPIKGVEEVERGKRAKVVMVYQKAGRGMAELPGDWRAFAKLGRNEDTWHAYVVPGLE